MSALVVDLGKARIERAIAEVRAAGFGIYRMENLEAAAGAFLPELSHLSNVHLVVAEVANRLSAQHPEEASLLTKSAGFFDSFTAACHQLRYAVLKLDALPDWPSVRASLSHHSPDQSA